MNSHENKKTAPKDFTPFLSKVCKVMLIDQRMIMAYIDEVRIKLGTLLKILFLMKIVWVVDFAKTNMKIEAPLVLNHVSYICTPKNEKK